MQCVQIHDKLHVQDAYFRQMTTALSAPSRPALPEQTVDSLQHTLEAL